MNGRRRGNGRGRRDRGGPAPAMPPPGRPGRHCYSGAIAPGMKVYVVKKEDQRSGRETMGLVSRVLTNSAYHPRGIKVMLDDGVVGRVARFDGDPVNANRDAGSGDYGENNGEGDMASPGGPSNSRTVADFLPKSNDDNEIGTGSDESLHQLSSDGGVNADALATLVDGMNFDVDKSREALQMFDNDVQRAVDFLIRQAAEDE